MGDPPRAFLERHVRTFNAAVESGDFAPLVELFAPDARLEFVGVPVGPFEGRDAIAAAYAAQPPTDTMTILDARSSRTGRSSRASRGRATAVSGRARCGSSSTGSRSGASSSRSAERRSAGTSVGRRSAPPHRPLSSVSLRFTVSRNSTGLRRARADIVSAVSAARQTSSLPRPDPCRVVSICARRLPLRRHQSAGDRRALGCGPPGFEAPRRSALCGADRLEPVLRGQPLGRDARRVAPREAGAADRLLGSRVAHCIPSSER